MESPENEYISIPNSLYDVVFRYLMEDNESAKILISTLINEKIKKLVFEPVSHAEKVRNPQTEQEVQLFHLDFTATIEKPDGSEELIMIEIQKANLGSDIFRFKRYISANFQKRRETEIINPISQVVEKIQQPIRLIPIFILNFRIENEVNDLIIRTQRLKKGIFREKILEKTNEFIDHLSFDMWVVQLPNLSKIMPEEYEHDEYKSKLYALLKLFDQNAQKMDNPHRLLFLRHAFPDFLQRLINRLKAAEAENPDLEEQMHVEDEYLAELVKRDNMISFYKAEWEKAQKQSEEKDQILQEKDQILQEKDQILQEKDQILQEKDQILQEKDQILQEKDRLIFMMIKTFQELGLSVEEIQIRTGLAKETVERWLKF